MYYIHIINNQTKNILQYIICMSQIYVASMLGQSFNLGGIVEYVQLYRQHRAWRRVTSQSTMIDRETQDSAGEPRITRKPHVGYTTTTTCNNSIHILPHIETCDLRNVDWQYLKDEMKFMGVIFDKDNTLTLPYEKHVHPYAREALEACCNVFGKDMVALYSNSAGLEQFDGPDYAHAVELEECMGIRVMRHATKKPVANARTRAEVEAWGGVGCESLIMVGDRYMTDVVFGNALGMLTVRVEPLTRMNATTTTKNREPWSVGVSRWMEESLVARCVKDGMEPPALVRATS